MRAKIWNLILICGALTVMLGAANEAAAQTDRQRAVRLRSGVAVRGFVGGEGRMGYVIRARRGQAIVVEISRAVPRDGNFNLTVSRSGDFMEAEAVRFGRETNTRRLLRWTGRAPASGNYYFYLTGYSPNPPNGIRYVLKAAVR